MGPNAEGERLHQGRDYRYPEPIAAIGTTSTLTINAPELPKGFDQKATVKASAKYAVPNNGGKGFFDVTEYVTGTYSAIFGLSEPGKEVAKVPLNDATFAELLKGALVKVTVKYEVMDALGQPASIPSTWMEVEL